MIKVIRNDLLSKTIHFEDLQIGDIYKDEEGLVCIKVSNDMENENALTYEWNEVGKWVLTFEASCAEVTPIEADLIIK